MLPEKFFVVLSGFCAAEATWFPLMAFIWVRLISVELNFVCSWVVGLPGMFAGLVGVTGIVPGIGLPCTGEPVFVTLFPPVVVLELLLPAEVPFAALMFTVELLLLAFAFVETLVLVVPVGTVIPLITVVEFVFVVLAAAAESFNRCAILSLTFAGSLLLVAGALRAVVCFFVADVFDLVVVLVCADKPPIHSAKTNDRYILFILHPFTILPQRAGRQYIRSSI